MKKIAFIGAGAMAEALISGMVAQNIIESKNIFVTNKSNEAKLANLSEKYGVNWNKKYTRSNERR